MQLLRSLRLDSSSASGQTICLVGAGGKSTALFMIARQLVRGGIPAVLVTASTHLGVWQTMNADKHIIVSSVEDLPDLTELHDVTLCTGEIKEDRTSPIDPIALRWLHENIKGRGIPLLIEADGAHMLPIKAPAPHEPPIPEFADMVIVVAGLSALGRPLTDQYVHRAEIFSRLSGLALDESISADAIIRVLTHPAGGLKNIPRTARRIALLNQAEPPELQSIGGSMAHELLEKFDSVIVGSLKQDELQTIERTAAIILAAGESTRFGRPKQLLEWQGKPFVRHIAETALHAGLSPVVVVTGFQAAEIESALKDLPLVIAHNPDYSRGQSTSIRVGLQALPGDSGASIFLLSDQPQIPVEVMRTLTERHARELQPILAPLVLEERRANPVLFDRVTFPELMKLTGDVGGRAIFDKFKVEYLPWHDDRLLFDVDTPEDYERLKKWQ